MRVRVRAYESVEQLRLAPLLKRPLVFQFTQSPKQLSLHRAILYIGIISYRGDTSIPFQTLFPNLP
jgi:hypothetical protein